MKLKDDYCIERAIYCYNKDKERLKKQLTKTIKMVEEYIEDTSAFNEYIEVDNEMVENSKYNYLYYSLKELNDYLELCYMQKLTDIYNTKKIDNIFLNNLKFLEKIL